jgi:hypothetical protein
MRIGNGRQGEGRRLGDWETVLPFSRSPLLHWVARGGEVVIIKFEPMRRKEMMA